MKYSRLSVAFALLAAGAAAACGSSNNPATPGPTPADGGADGPTGSDAGDSGTEPPCTDTALDLQGEQLASKTLVRNCVYRLTGSYSVYGAGVTLTIEPGVVIEGQGSFHLKVSQGARMLANGTAARPITMRSSDASRATGWQGLMLGGAAAGTKHELHNVVVRDGASAGDPGDDTAPAVYVWGDAGTTEVLFDHLTVEDSKHGGIRLYREPVTLTQGSTDIVVRNVPGYPIVLDPIHGAQLPARQTFESTTPARARILMFGGNESTLFGDHVWPPQKVPFELAADIDLGDVGKPSSLTIQPPATILMRDVADLRTTHGKFVFKSTAADKITFDWAEENKPWGAIIMTATNQSTTAHQSVLEGVTFKHGGKSDPMVYILGPGGPGNLGDCSVGATVKGCTFSDPAPGGSPNCLAATDHSNAYDSENTFTGGCTADVKCD